MAFKTHAEEVAEFNAVRLFTGMAAGSMDAIAYQLEGNTVESPISDAAIAAFLRAHAKKLYALNHGEPMEIVTQVPLPAIAARDGLIAALVPFAKYFKPHHEAMSDETVAFGLTELEITVGDLRKAVAAIAKAKGE